jgi:hypothetical protein
MSREAILAKIESLPEESRKQLLAFLNFLAEQSGNWRQPPSRPVSSSTGPAVWPTSARNSPPSNCRTRPAGGDELSGGHERHPGKPAQPAKVRKARAVFPAKYRGAGHRAFSLHSIGVIALRRQQAGMFAGFPNNSLANLELLHLDRIGYPAVARAARLFNLGFDNACQFTLAKAHGLAVATQDQHFARVKNGVEVRFI